MSWEPLRGDDPLPGDPAAVGDYADDLTSTADLIVEQAAVLRRLADRSNWVADTADAFRERAADLAADIEKAEGRYRAVGSELSAWSDTLADAQRQARSMRDEAQELQRVVAANPLPVPAPLTPDGPPELTPAQEAQRGRHEAAREGIERLRNQLDRLVAETQEQGWDRGRRIRASLDDDMANGFWDWAKAKLSGLSGVFRQISKYAGYIALALGIVALVLAVFFTPVGWVLLAAAAATAVSLLANAGLAASENGSWSAVLFDGIALVTFGVGRYATAGAKGAMALARPAVATARAAAARAASLSASPRLLAIASRLSTTRFVPGLLRRPAMSYQAFRAGQADTAAAAARATVDVMPDTTAVQRLVFGGTTPVQMRLQAQQFLKEFPDVAEIAVPAREALRMVRVNAASTAVADVSSIVGSYVKPESATSDLGRLKTLVGRLSRIAQ